jgi:hypothetical protein
LDFSSSGGDQGDPGHYAERAAAEDQVHRVAANAFAEVDQAKHGAWVFGELAEPPPVGNLGSI